MPPKPDTLPAPDLSHRAARERKALWVALALVVVWGAYKDMERSALAYLVHRERGAQRPLGLDEVDALAQATVQRASKLKTAEVVADLEALAATSQRADAESPAQLRARTLGRVVVDVVQTSSFSRIASGSYALPQATDEALDRDPVPAREAALSVGLSDTDADGARIAR